MKVFAFLNNEFVWEFIKEQAIEKQRNNKLSLLFCVYTYVYKN